MLHITKIISQTVWICRAVPCFISPLTCTTRSLKFNDVNRWLIVDLVKSNSAVSTILPSYCWQSQQRHWVIVGVSTTPLSNCWQYQQHRWVIVASMNNPAESLLSVSTKLLSHCCQYQQYGWVIVVSINNNWFVVATAETTSSNIHNVTEPFLAPLS